MCAQLLELLLELHGARIAPQHLARQVADRDRDEHGEPKPHGPSAERGRFVHVGQLLHPLARR